MQGLANVSTLGGSFNASQVQSFFAQNGTERWFFDWLAPDGAYQGDLTPWVTDVPVIDHNSSNSVKRTLKMRLQNTSVPGYGKLPPIDIFQDLIRARYQLRAPDGGWLEWDMGIFCQYTLQRAVNWGFTKLDLAWNDLSQLLADDKFLSGYAVSANADIVSAVNLIVAGYTGITPLNVSIPNQGATLNTDLTWSAGDAKLKAVTDLLAAGNYYSPWMDGYTLRSRPIPDTNTIVPPVSWDATAGQSPVTATAPNETIDRTQAANVITVVGNTPSSGAGRPLPPPQATYVNDRPDSPISTSRWRRVVKMVQDGKIADVATAYQRAIIEAQLAARIYSSLTIGTVPWPVNEDHDFYGLVYFSNLEGTVDEVYEDVAWTMNCSPGAEMQHTLQRLVAA